MFHKGGSGQQRGFGYGGFQMPSKKETKLPDSPLAPPTINVPYNKRGYMGLQAITQNAIYPQYGVQHKRPKTEEEYFEQDDEEDNANKLEYIPAPGSPTLLQQQKSSQNSDSEEDPLDAYMAGIETQVKKDFKKLEEKPSNEPPNKGIRDDIENEDDEESYYRFIEENPDAFQEKEDSEPEIEYDEDGNPIITKIKYIDPLPPIDHSTIEYKEFEKNFYEEHPDISKLTDQEAEELRAKLGIKVTGPSPPKPVSSFGHFGFDENLMKAIRKSEYTQPTPIQAQGIPIAMSGRDMIGIAKTGSGKTAAFLWPMLVHIMDQPELKEGDGPIGLILAPTRELAQQIYLEAKRFGKVYGIHAVCAFGGGSKWDQCKALQEGAEIVVATPGRIIDLIKAKATNLQRVTMLVLDEADKMFNMGFEPQVRSICDHVRPDRQMLMFSATFKKKVERLARDALQDPVRVVQGELGEANENVIQHMVVMLPTSKFPWLLSRLVSFTSLGSVLIFVTKKANSEELANQLRLKDFEVGLLHGDMDQNERTKVITSFKKKEFPVLVATDVAARGLDIPHVKTVINYDLARDIDTHTHRIGRTGRAGETGTAYTLVTERDKEFAGHLVRNLEGANQPVPQDLLDLAMQSSWFRNARFKQGKGKKLNIGGAGLGYRERPGLGANTEGSRKSGGGGSVGAVSILPPTLQQISRPSGPQSDRLANMKMAFAAQYKSQFTAATDTAWKMNVAPPPPPAEPTSGRRKKTRWSS